MLSKKKLFAVVLSSMMAFSVFTQVACGSGDAESSTKTVINVQFYNAGYGSAYMEDAEAEFEKIFADRSFEEGKIGVDVVLDGNKSIGTDLQASIAHSKADLFFNEQIYYHEFVNQSLVANIDDVLSDKGTDFGENESVYDKMSEPIKNAYKYSDGSYYALPTYFSAVGINYNINLFDDYKLYFAAEKNNGNGGFILNASDKKSNGPDGRPDTYDDGLPATYEEFYTLCEKMLDYNITPVSWGNLTYLNNLLTQLQSDYEGVSDMTLNFSFNGQAKHIIKSINTDGSLVLEEKAVTETNGYEVYKQAGRYYALNFIETLIKNGYVNTASLSSSSAYSYTAAQQDFIMSGIKGKKEIGMLIEGCWWENEAAGIFNELESTLGSKYAKSNMRFGFMPLPKATADLVGTKSCSTCSLNPAAIINAKSTGAKLQVAKLFLRFMLTDKQMNNFVSRVGVPFVYDFDINVKTSSAYGQSMSAFVSNTDLAFPLSSSPVYMKNASTFNIWFNYWNTLVSGTSYSNMTPIIDGNVTAAQYFNGLYALRSQSWSSLSK